MSIKVVVYVPTLSKDLLLPIAAQFVSLGMECQFHPGFALDPITDSGLVSVRLRVGTSQESHYQEVDMLSGFEIAFKDFRYASPLAVSPTINEKLKACTKQVIIRMHATPTNSFRTGLYFATFLAKVTDGIVYNPRSDEYLDYEQAFAHSTHEIRNYEKELPLKDWTVIPFSGWT